MSEPTISIQAYICPVCHDDHSTGPHRFTDEELAQHDAELRKEIAWEIRAMGSESWDGYTPDEVPGTVAARIAEAPDA